MSIPTERASFRALDGAHFDVVLVGLGAAGSAFAREFTRVSTPGATALAVHASETSTEVRVMPGRGRARAWEARRADARAVTSNAVRATRGTATAADADARTMTVVSDACGDAVTVSYGTLVVATGARARRVGLEGAEASAVTVRDAEDARALARRVAATAMKMGGGRIALVGNGGIALELVDALCGTGLDVPGLDACELTWVVRHGAVGDAFFDADAAEFLSRALEARRGSGVMVERASDATDEGASGGTNARTSDETEERDATKDATTARTSETSEENARKRAKVSRDRTHSSKISGAAAGPDWIARLCAEAEAATPGTRTASARRRMRLRVVKNAEILDAKRVVETGASVLTLTNGSTLEVDFVVAATGVEPRCDWLSEDVAPRSRVDGGILVDECMRTVGPYADSILAIGDACSMESRSNDPDVPWFQMRLWSQAAQAGAFAARVVAGVADGEAFGFNYELFTHVTKFFGLKVVLLGLYNAQKLDKEPESDVVTYQRETLGDKPTYIRVLLLRGRMMGAVLIGDTDLEETFENLILDGVDLSRFGPDLLDPEFDLEDYFD